MSRTRQPIFRNATATSHIHTLSLHDALPISYSEALEMTVAVYRALAEVLTAAGFEGVLVGDEGGFGPRLSSNEQAVRSEEHTSELQSQSNLVCRLLLEKKKQRQASQRPERDG